MYTLGHIEIEFNGDVIFFQRKDNLACAFVHKDNIKEHLLEDIKDLKSDPATKDEYPYMLSIDDCDFLLEHLPEIQNLMIKHYL